MKFGLLSGSSENLSHEHENEGFVDDQEDEENYIIIYIAILSVLLMFSFLILSVIRIMQSSRHMEAFSI